MVARNIQKKQKIALVLLTQFEEDLVDLRSNGGGLPELFFATKLSCEGFLGSAQSFFMLDASWLAFHQLGHSDGYLGSV